MDPTVIGILFAVCLLLVIALLWLLTRDRKPPQSPGRHEQPPKKPRRRPRRVIRPDDQPMPNQTDHELGNDDGEEPPSTEWRDWR
jgi:hypothetical protein